MTHQIETDCFLNDLERVVQVRAEVAVALEKIADTIDKAEINGDTTSGKLSLERDIEDIRLASKNLRTGVFRLLVLGDMKRGKSILVLSSAFICVHLRFHIKTSAIRLFSDRV